jgi:hypothetical protein
VLYLRRRRRRRRRKRLEAGENCIMTSFIVFTP